MYRITERYRNIAFGRILAVTAYPEQNYNFGKSEDVSKAGFKNRICDLVSGLSGPSRGPLFLVFHDNSQDIKYVVTLAGFLMLNLF
jgi:hypothetical protein